MNIKVILFLLSFIAVSITGLFIYSPTVKLILIFLLIYVASVLSINLGWHRYFSHKSFRCNQFIENLFLFFGSSLFFGKISDWIKEHRDHHVFLNTKQDPQKTLDNFIKRAYWMCWNSSVNSSEIETEFNTRYFKFINKYSIFSSIINNIILVVLVNLIVTDTLPVIIWFIVFLRVTLIFNIYTLTHACGHHSRLYFLHYFNLGEGNHEEHHKRPKKIEQGYNLTSLVYQSGIALKVFYE